MPWRWPLALVCAIGAPSLPFALAQEQADFSETPVGLVLTQWERASEGLLGVGPLEHRRLHYLHGANHSAHEIAVLNEFRGPVSADDLTRRFEWSIRATTAETILIGRPTDEVEQLFYRELTVAIDPKTHLPESVRFTGTHADGAREPLTVVMSPRIEEPNRFRDDPHARPLKVASHDDGYENHSPIRVVEHVTPKSSVKPELPADVVHALTVLETNLRQVRSLHANVRRYTYETQSHIEHRAVGELSYASPTTVDCTLKPCPIDPHATSHRRTTDGMAFELLASPAEHWQYTASEIRFSHPPHQPAWVLSQAGGHPQPIRFVSREEHQATDGTNPMIPPWPMLFHANALELAERFHIRIADQQHMATWDFTPREPGDWGRFRQMRVLFDNSNSLPKAVQFMNASGDVETVYTFQYAQIQRHVPFGIEPEVLPPRPDMPKLEPAPTTLHGLP